ncbi:MAG: competence/damage-inducible protein A [Bacteroidales bacterium]|nr:competence/damage-inducible protein A [Bacteroidales bacterium]
MFPRSAASSRNCQFHYICSMNVEIINIGDELLIGQVVNTNAAWMAEQLSLSGFRVYQNSAITDSRRHILQALAEAEKRAEIVLVSGGIGPTKDDITKHVLCEFFNTRLVFDADAYHDIEALFAQRGYQVTELNRRQAELPETCMGIPNELGTARGMWFEKDRPGGGVTVFVSMPGVPFEMKAMMTGFIIPRLKEKFKTPFIYHRTLLTQGIGESFLAVEIEDWENALPANIKLAYLPQPGMVRLRLTGEGADEALLHQQVDEEIAKLQTLVKEYFFGYDQEAIEIIVGRLLKDRNSTLATAESCTGGAIAAMITSIPGSSDYYKGSVVAYSNEIKENILGVSAETLEKYGAVSQEVVTEMAISLRTKFKVDYAIATSGIAGPDGGTAEKPVGTSWIAIATPDEVFAEKYLFGESRERNIRRTGLQALSLLRKKLLMQAM